MNVDPSLFYRQWRLTPDDTNHLKYLGYPQEKIETMNIEQVQTALDNRIKWETDKPTEGNSKG